MAYGVDITRQIGEVVNGRPTYVYQVTETGEIPLNAEWVIEGVPKQSTITLIEALVFVADLVTDIQTEIGWLPGWTTGQNGHIDQAATPGSPIRIAQDKRVTADGRIYGRSNPNNIGGPAANVTTFLSVTLGHR